MEVQHLLTDHGRGFCGGLLGHPYELFLAINQIEHRRTDVACRRRTASASASIVP